MNSKEDLSWVEDQEYTCDTCGKGFPLGTMIGGHTLLQCEKCYNKPITTEAPMSNDPLAEATSEWQELPMIEGEG